MKIAVPLAILLAAGSAAADKDQALGRLERALPRGWSLLATETELVLRHDRPVYCTDHPNGPLVTLELRYKLEPKWTPEHLAEVKAANDKVTAELGKTHDRRTEAKLRASLSALPVCTLDHSSIVERPDTYSQLALTIDPADIKAEATSVRELVTKKCPPAN
jgi:hypothetical protein